MRKKTSVPRELILHPGETIADVLEARGISQFDLADYEAELSKSEKQERRLKNMDAYTETGIKEIDAWIDGYKVRSLPWVDGKSIYFSVSYYAPGQSLSKPPVWEKVAYITDNEAGRRAIREAPYSLTNYVAGLEIPRGGYATLTFLC